MMTKKIFYFLTICMIYSNANGQNIEWKKVLDDGTVWSNCIVLDDSGNVFTSGQYTGYVDFDADETTNYLNSNQTTSFITKHNNLGKLIWAKSYDFYINAIAVDTNGAIYITGRFNHHRAGLSKSIFGDTSLTSYGGDDVCIFKLNSLGEYLWARSIGSTNDDESVSITIDGTNNVYVLSHLNLYAIRDSVDIDPTPKRKMIMSYGKFILVLKLDASGNLIWAKSKGTPIDYYKPRHFTVDKMGNVLIIGSHNFSSFILKLNSEGDSLWQKDFGLSFSSGTEPINGVSIGTDEKGNVYCAGYLYGNNNGASVDFDPSNDTVYLKSNGYEDFYVTKFNPNGELLWAKSIGGKQREYINTLKVSSASDLLFLTGSFEKTCDFDPNIGVNELVVNHEGSDIFVLVLDNNGNFKWVKKVGSLFSSKSYDMCVDKNDAIYLTGNHTAIDRWSAYPYLVASSQLVNQFVMKLDNTITSGLNDNYYQSDFFVYPNPTFESITVQYSKHISKNEYRIMDLTGKEILHGKLDSFSTVIDLNVLREGIYLLTTGEKDTFSFIKK